MERKMKKALANSGKLKAMVGVGGRNGGTSRRLKPQDSYLCLRKGWF